MKLRPVGKLTVTVRPNAEGTANVLMLQDSRGVTYAATTADQQMERDLLQALADAYNEALVPA